MNSAYCRGSVHNRCGKGLRLSLHVFYILLILIVQSSLSAYPLIYTVEYGPRPTSPPSLIPERVYNYLNQDTLDVVVDNWYYASRERADLVGADVFIIPGGSTSDVPFYDGRLDSYVELLRNPGRPAFGFCAGIQFLMMSQGGICARRSGEHGNEDAVIFLEDEIFEDCPNPYTDRASHNYSIVDVPDCYRILARTRTCYVSFAKHESMPLYGSQLHIESMNNPNSGGPAILDNFFNNIVKRPFHGIAELDGFPGEPGKVTLNWWPANIEGSVKYRIFHSTDSLDLEFSEPEWIASGHELMIENLNPDITHYFAVTMISEDSIGNEEILEAETEYGSDVVLSIIPDGRSQLTFQNGVPIDDDIYDSCEATVIYNRYPNSNYGRRGAFSSLELDWWDSGLVQFKDLDIYLTGKEIISARLTYIFAGGVTNYTTSQHVAYIRIYPILKSWNEGRGSGHSTAYFDEVTWNSARHGSDLWDVPGCKGDMDRTTEPIADYQITGDGKGIEFDGTIELPPELVQKWIDNPESNHGLLFEKEDTYPADDYFHFEDDDDEWFMNRPRLIVTYLDKAETAVANQNSSEQPISFSLHQNYPNPFNQSTQIPFVLNRTGEVNVMIFNLLGQKIRTLHEGVMNAGEHYLEWDGCDMNNTPVCSGVYVYLLSASGRSEIRRLVVLR